MMTAPFRWRNCYADVASGRHGEIAQSYLRAVVTPSLSALDDRISKLGELSRQEDPAAIFSIEPARELLRATLMGFCLAIQSLWEQQIRRYLKGCANSLAPGNGMQDRIQKATWQELDAIFKDLRGVPLSAFDEYEDLDLLQLLGNVCRHGDGHSLQRLARAHPELWPREPELDVVPPSPGHRAERISTVENLSISRELLRRFVDRIDSFWLETEYIYNESIQPKHPSLETRLVEERRMRTGRGRPWDPT